jgi:uncharacterized protein
MKVASLAVVLILAWAFFAFGMFFEVPSLHGETKIVYQTVKEYVNNTIEVPVGQIYEKNITVHGVAVFNNSGGGELIDISLALRPGHGGVLLDVSDKTFGADFQSTLPMLRQYAESYTGKNLDYKDIIIRLETVAETVQGISGSAAIEAGLIAMLDDMKLRNDTVITGSLNPDGTLGPVSALNEKIGVAKSAGIDYFLMPKVECSEVNESAAIGIQVTCVNSISEALARMTA